MKSVDSLLHKIDQIIINPIIYLLFGAALIVFLWGVVQFIMKNDSEDGRKTGARHILWGLVGMFIMLSAFGIITIIVNTFGIDSSSINSIRR